MKNVNQDPRAFRLALHKKSAKPNKSEPEAIATGLPLILRRRWLTVKSLAFPSNGDPVATASGSDTASRTFDLGAKAPSFRKRTCPLGGTQVSFLNGRKR